MAFRLSLIHVAPRQQVAKFLPTTRPLSFLPTTTLNQPLTTTTTTSPMMLGNQFQTNYQRQVSQSFFQLCAVPKKKTSPRRKKVRAQGRWEREAHVVYKSNYQICLECRRAMLPQQVCTANKDCMTFPRF